MRANPLPLIGGFYADETRPWSQQDICNYLPVAAESEGTRTPTMAKTPPGLSPFARISGDPSRGVYSAEDRLFTVMGNTLYQVTPTDAILLGSISGSSRVRFAHNQITGGNQVLIVNGSAGWVWNTNTSTLTLITDTGYPGAINARFIDGYLVQIEPARRFAFHSDLADALSYNTLDRFTSEVSPDLLVSMAVSNNELILFSERTAEFFENTGATQQPFRSKRISFNRGCAGRFAAIEMDNSVFWLGDDGSFYRLDGYTPLRISTRPIEQAIRGLNWDGAFAFVWKDSGHSVCYWTFPGGLTFGFDASQGKWHRRASYGFGRWRVQDLTNWQGRWVAGDFQKGRLWELDWAYPWEFDQEFISELTSPVIHDNQSRVLMPRLEVIMDTGMPEVAVRDWEVDQATLAISGNVPDGFVDDSVSMSYVVSGGVPQYIVSVASGTFPPGLTLSSTGAVSGAFSTAGSYSWVVQVVDGDGDVATVPDTADVTLVTWLIAYGTSGGTSLEISLGGMDFSGAGFAPSPNWAPGSVAYGAKNGASFLLTTSSPSVGNYGLFYNGASFSTTTGLTLNAAGGQSVFVDGFWLVATGSSVARSENGTSFTAAAPSVETICTDGPSAWAANASRQIHKTVDAGASWGLVSTLSFEYAWTQFMIGAGPSELGLAILEAGSFGGGGATDARCHIKSSADSGANWTTQTSPFADAIDPVSIGRPVIYYSSGLGLWFVGFQNRIAYGASLSALTLSARVFPQLILGISSDNVRAVVNGSSGMLEHSPDGVAWTQVPSGIPSTNIQLAMPQGLP